MEGGGKFLIQLFFQAVTLFQLFQLLQKLYRSEPHCSSSSNFIKVCIMLVVIILNSKNMSYAMEMSSMLDIISYAIFKISNFSIRQNWYKAIGDNYKERKSQGWNKKRKDKQKVPILSSSSAKKQNKTKKPSQGILQMIQKVEKNTPEPQTFTLASLNKQTICMKILWDIESKTIKTKNSLISG